MYCNVLCAVLLKHVTILFSSRSLEGSAVRSKRKSSARHSSRLTVEIAGYGTVASDVLITRVGIVRGSVI